MAGTDAGDVKGAELGTEGTIAVGVDAAGGAAGGCRVMLGSVALRCPPSMAIANVAPPATMTAAAPAIASFHFGGLDSAGSADMTTPLDAPIVVVIAEAGAMGMPCGVRSAMAATF